MQRRWCLRCLLCLPRALSPACGAVLRVIRRFGSAIFGILVVQHIGMKGLRWCHRGDTDGYCVQILPGSRNEGNRLPDVYSLFQNAWTTAAASEWEIHWFSSCTGRAGGGPRGSDVPPGCRGCWSNWTAAWRESSFNHITIRRSLCSLFSVCHDAAMSSACCVSSPDVQTVRQLANTGSMFNPEEQLNYSHVI